MSSDDRRDADHSLGGTLARLVLEYSHACHELDEEVQAQGLDEVKRREGRPWRLGTELSRATGGLPGALSAPRAIARVLAGPVGRVRPAPTRPARSAQPAIRLRSDSGARTTPTMEEAVAQRRQRLAETVSSGRRLRVAALLEDDVRVGFSRLCDYAEIDNVTWRDVLTDSVPDLVVVDSASLRRAETAREGTRPDVVLRSIAEFAHALGVATALWITDEDPASEIIAALSTHTDYVFTIDLDSVPRLVQTTGHDRVALLPPAVEPTLHHPFSGKARRDVALFGVDPHLRDAVDAGRATTLIGAAATHLPVEAQSHELGIDGGWEQVRAVVTRPAELKPAWLMLDEVRLGLDALSSPSSTAISKRLLAFILSGTPVVACYSRAIRVLLGDLVPMSDSPKVLASQVGQELAGTEATVRRRAAALRRVIGLHTYADRFESLVHSVAGLTSAARRQVIAVLAAVDDASQAETIIATARGQHGIEVALTLVSDAADVHALAGDDVRVVGTADAAHATVASHIGDASAAAVFAVSDWYGPRYLQSMGHVLRFGVDAATKRARFVGDCVVDTEHEYTLQKAGDTLWRRALVRAGAFQNVTVEEAVRPDARVPAPARIVATDRYDFCEGLPLPEVALRASLAESGTRAWSLEELDQESTRLATAAHAQAGRMWIDEETFPSGLFEQSGKGQAHLRRTNAELLVSFESHGGQLWYLGFGGDLPLSGETSRGRTIQLHFDIETFGNGVLGVNLSWLDKDRRPIPGMTYFRAQHTHEISVPANAVRVRVIFTFRASGVALVRGIELSEHATARQLVPQLLRSPTRKLLVTDYYPSYELPYQRGFIHSRVKSYIDNGAEVAVWCTNQGGDGVSYREFDGVEVIEGSNRALRTVLDSGAFDTVVVHTMYEHLWTILRDFVDDVRVVAWFHGAELHRWWLNPTNPTMDDPRAVQIAQIKEDRRFAYWRSVLADPHPNLSFVVVSQTFLDQMNEDLGELGVGFPPERTRVIFNPIDPARFSYIPKGPEQRLRLLSLRPFWHGKYANDLTVQAIVDLSSEPWFEELEIMVAGDGAHFHEIVAPLRGMPNVSLVNRFFTQVEIAELHKLYGVALVPTRADSQGVSRDEAMSSGLVPITTQVDAIPEFVSDDEGYVVPPEDARAIADAVRHLYHNPDVFMRKSAASAARIRRTVSDDIIIPQEIEAFANLGERGEVGARPRAHTLGESAD